MCLPRDSLCHVSHCAFTFTTPTSRATRRVPSSQHRSRFRRVRHFVGGFLHGQLCDRQRRHLYGLNRDGGLVASEDDAVRPWSCPSCGDAAEGGGGGRTGSKSYALRAMRVLQANAVRVIETCSTTRSANFQKIFCTVHPSICWIRLLQ